MKRFTDIVISLIALILTSPIFVAVPLLLRLTSPGPAFFRQERIGKNLMPFNMLKFRSMVVGAEAKGPHFTREADPRITTVGRFIRRTSIDELPQLINVLKGEMSLVGPRPDTPGQIVDYSEENWRERHQVRPGITGLAQAMVRSEATPEERLAFDLDYVRRNSLWLDVKIMIMTVSQILTRGGN